MRIGFVVFLCVAASLSAADLQVVVEDRSGGRIPEATVQVFARDQTPVTEVATDSDGVAWFAELDVGRYEVVVRADRFAPAAVLVDTGAVDELVVALDVATVATTIEVSTALPELVGEAELERDAVTASPSTDLVGALQAVPGVNTLRRGGTNIEPVVMGLRETQIAMVVDGTRTFAAGPARMDSELSHVEPRHVEEVLVVSGPYALTEGAGAQSAITVVTPQVPTWDDWRWGGQTSGGYETNGAGRYGYARLFGAGSRFGFSLRASGNKSNDYLAGGPGDGPAIPGDTSNHQFGGKVRFRVAENQELLLGSFYDEQTGVDYPGRLLNAEHFLLRSWSGNYLISEPTRGVKAAKFGLYLNKKSHRMSNDEKPTARDMPGRRPPFALRVDLPTEADTFGGAASVDFETPDGWRLKTGFDFYHLTQDAQRFVSRQSNGFVLFSDAVWPDARIDDQGLYAQVTRPFERGEISGTVRVDFVQADAGRPTEFFLQNTSGTVDQNEVNTSVSLAGRYRLARGISLGGGFGRVVRTANALERYSDRFPSTKFQIAAEFLGAPALAPESSWQGDASVEIRRGSVSVEFGGFVRRMENFITIAADPSVPKRLPLSPPTVFRYGNGDHANFRGFQLGVRYEPTRWLRVRTSGAKTIADDIEAGVAAIGVNEPVLGIAPLEVNSALRLMTPSGHVWGEYSLRNVWDQRRVAASRFETPSPGFSTHALRMGANLGADTVVHFGIANLGDKGYSEHLNSLNPFSRTRIPEPGRSVFFGFSKAW